MLPASEPFRELMESNVRPKCEPIITIKDALGTGRDLVWKAKDISKMTFKRGIDPIGRTLPFMELRWTEVYQGKLNENLYPQIYENVAALLPVELKFKQSLGFYNTWEDVFKSGGSWKELFDKKITWKQLKNEALEEEFVFPMMFLSSRPIINENVIEWVAYDLLRLLDFPQTMYFGNSHNGLAYYGNIWCYILQNSGAPFIENEYIIKYIERSIPNFHPDGKHLIEAPVLIDGASNSALKDSLASLCYYMDFGTDQIKTFFSDTNFIKSDFFIPLKNQYKNPIVTKNQNISEYLFNKYFLNEKADGRYEKEWDSYKTFLSSNDPSQDIYVFEYVFNGYGKEDGEAIEEGNVATRSGGIKKAYSIGKFNTGFVPAKDDFKINVIPIEMTHIEEKIKSNFVDGEPFVENNKTNGIGAESNLSLARFDFLNRYFNKKCDSLEISCVPNVALETRDIIKIETNFEDGFGVNKTKDAVIVEITLDYAGKLTQTIKAHEVVV